MPQIILPIGLDLSDIETPAYGNDHTPSPHHWTTADGRRIPYTEMADAHLLNAYRWVVATCRQEDVRLGYAAARRHWRPAHDTLRAEIDRRGLKDV